MKKALARRRRLVPETVSETADATRPRAAAARAVLLASLLFLLLGTAARAATITVTRADDRNATCNPGVDCSLREAVALANAQAGADTINFALTLPATITLSNGEISVTSDVNVVGPGQGLLTVSGANASRIFALGAGTTVGISRLALTGGNGIGASPAVQGGGAIRAGGALLTLDTVRIINNPAGSTVGGGVYVPAGALTVINSTFTGNTATAGGAIYHDGTTLRVQGSTFNGNQATSSSDEGGGGAIYADDPTVVSNSTFSGNSTAYYGGAIYFIGTSIETLTVRNSTITGNAAGEFAGGVGNFGDGGGTVANNIISLNTAGSLPNYYDGGSISEVSNYTGNAPGLGPLADNGGPTQTHALLSGSPAIDAGNDAHALDVNGAPLTTDQRGPGFPRFVDGPDGDSSPTVDLGAYEFGTGFLVVTKTADTNDGACDADCSLREAVAAANVQPSADVIGFAAGLSGQTITLSTGEIDITTNLSIIGLGQNSLTVSGGGASRIFNIAAGTTVAVNALTLTGGNGTGASAVVQGGGAIRAGGALLTLDTVRVVNNPAGSTVGGGVYVPAGALTVINSTFSGNTATAGGAIYHDGTTLKVQGSTFNGNQATSSSDEGGGGAIYADDPTVVSNSTFSGNSTAYSGGGVYFIGTSVETLVVRNSTFTANSAADFAGGVGNFGDGGGTVANNIISLNTAGSLPNYYDGGSISEANNYTGNAPNLGPLADNGGPTQTHALLTGSPAVNAGNNAHALDVNGAPLTTDQRGPGFPRFLSGTVDIGAFEGVQAGNNPPTITPAGPLSRQQGSPGGAAVQIATVGDAETAAGSLAVTVVAGGTATGVSVTSITNTNGTITAVVEASCSATSGTVRLQVSDGTATATGDLTVNVTPNAAPTLAYPDPQYVITGGSLMVSPSAGPSDNGSVASIVLQGVSPNTFAGTVGVDGTTGVVTVSNAGPAGDYTVTVRATDNCGATTDATFVLRVVTPAAAGQVILSEFRLNGPAGESDEFYELFNNTDAPVVVAAVDDSGGWALAAHDPATAGVQIVGMIPNGTVIPARGHYLVANTGIDCPCYSLGSYAAGDSASLNTSPATAGLTLFRTANPASFAAANRLDSAATGAESDPLYTEGSTLPAVASAAEYSFVRRLAGGYPQDTGDNAADFVLVSADTAAVGNGARLGAPGPENLSDPINLTGQIKSGLIDATVPASAAPNRFRDASPAAIDCAQNRCLGTLALRRRFTNNTGRDVTRLRVRVVDITTQVNGSSPPLGTADLRVLTSPGIAVTSNDPAVCGAAPVPCSVNLEGTVLEAPPAQPSGGGLNSTLAVASVTVATPLAPGASVDVEMLLGVRQGGSFRFLGTLDAATDPPTGTDAPAAAKSKSAPVAENSRQHKGAAAGGKP